MQMLLGVLIGAAGLIVFAALGMLLYYLRQASGNLKLASNVFAKSAEMANSIAAQVIATRQQIMAIEQMTAVIRAFNGLVLKGAGGEEELPPVQQTGTPRQPWGRTPPPPPVPAYDEFAPEGEAGVLSQTEEEQAELEIAQRARDLGIETDADLVEMPDPSKINFIES